ncbi:MAG: PP0621 family protein [Acidiferrobacterales bacterium]|nr:PP0621 family protein [Acidiferrobacterales bacterium]
MILRLLLGLLILWAIYRVIKLLGKTGENETAGRGQPEQMVKCDYCGTHIPAHDAIRSGKGTYCSSQHRDQDQSN